MPDANEASAGEPGWRAADCLAGGRPGPSRLGVGVPAGRDEQDGDRHRSQEGHGCQQAEQASAARRPRLAYQPETLQTSRFSRSASASAARRQSRPEPRKA